MRKGIGGFSLGVVLIFLAVGCESGEPEETAPEALTPDAVIDSLTGAHSDDDLHPEVQRALAITYDPLLVGEPNALYSYTRKLKDCTIDRKPVQNRHDPAQTDTAITLRCSAAMLHLYQRSDASVLLVKAEVTGPDVALAGGFRVGMPEAEAVTLAKDLWLYSARTNLRIMVQDPVTGSRLSAYIRNNVVSRLVFEGYVD